MTRLLQKIAIEVLEETYFAILEVRETFVLLWTAFWAEYKHQVTKKFKEYHEWKQGEGAKVNTPDELIALIQEGIKKQEANLLQPPP